LKGVEATGVH